MFFSQKPEFVAVGDIATDAFIRLKQADVVDNIDHTAKELCISFGDKVPFEFVKVVPGVGNSANAAVTAARLGLSSALVSNIGSDEVGKACLASLQRNSVSTKYITIHKNAKTNYHYVLWYGVERTILVKHEDYTYQFPKINPAPRWIYLSSLGENSLDYYTKIADYLKTHQEIKLAFQPGTYQIKLGTEKLKDIYARTHIFFCNVEESKRILKTEETDIKKLLQGIAALGPKIVGITDGINGAYAFDGTSSWFMPIYPHEPFERTGAGDAFSSTVTVALALGKSFEEALMWGPVNSMSVVQYVGAQEGLLTQEKLLSYLKNAPADYRPRKI